MRNHFVAVSLVIAFARAKKFNCCIHIVELTSQLFVITYLGELGLISRHFINCTVYHHAQSKPFSPYAILQNLYWKTFLGDEKGRIINLMNQFFHFYDNFWNTQSNCHRSLENEWSRVDQVIFQVIQHWKNTEVSWTRNTLRHRTAVFLWR